MSFRRLVVSLGVMVAVVACGADDGDPSQQKLSDRGLDQVTPKMVTAGDDCSTGEGDRESSGFADALPDASARWLLLDRPPTLLEPVPEVDTLTARMAFGGNVTALRRTNAADDELQVPERVTSSAEQEGIDELAVSPRIATSLDSLPTDTPVLIGVNAPPLPFGREVDTAFAVGADEELVWLFACAGAAFATTDLLANAPDTYTGTELDLVTGNEPELLTLVEFGPYPPPPLAPTPGGLTPAPTDAP